MTNSFSEKIKDEITKKTFDDFEALALIAGFLQAGGCVRKGEDVSLKIVTENERTATFLISILERFSVSSSDIAFKTDLRTNQDKFAFVCRDGAKQLAERTGSDGDKIPAFVSSKKKGAAYISGAFLASGSCSLPSEGENSPSGYHFEIKFSSEKLCDAFREYLSGFEILAKVVKRKNSYVLYVKSKEVISDILNLLGCGEALEAFYDLVEKKEISNNLNRAANCSVSNIDRSVKASVNMVRDIELIRSRSKGEELSEELEEVCDAKMENPDLSMSELAEKLNVTKSCLMHRMNKISAIAKSIREGIAK